MRRTAFDRIAGLTLGTLAIAAATGCGPTPPKEAERAAAASPARNAAVVPPARSRSDVKVLGIISARIDGKPRTWFVVDGRGSNGRYVSAVWLTSRGSSRIVTLGGFATRTPPLATFDYDVQRGDVSYGDFHGSTLGLVFSVPAGATRVIADLEADGAAARLAYAPVASTDPAEIYVSGPGSIEITHLGFDGQNATVRGRFHGTLSTTGGKGPVRIEDGRFNISGVPPRDALGS